MSIKDAISNAIAKFSSGDNSYTDTTKTPTETPVSEETKKTEVASEEKPAEKTEEKKPARDEKEIEKALELFDSLRNPETASDTLNLLVTTAKSRGILKTEEGRQEAAKDIITVLKESVHEDNHYMVDALAPGLEKIFKQLQDGQKVSTSTVEKKIDQIVQKEEEAQAEREIGEILGKDKYTPYLNELNALVDEFPLPEGVTIEKHLDRLLRIAKAESGEKKAQQKDVLAAEKTEKNLGERLPSSKTGNPDDVVIVNKKLNLQESIKLAKEGKKAVTA